MNTLFQFVVMLLKRVFTLMILYYYDIEYITGDMKKDDVIEDKFIKFKIIEDYLTRL
jgi:hypothetical protein